MKCIMSEAHQLLCYPVLYYRHVTFFDRTDFFPFGDGDDNIGPPEIDHSFPLNILSVPIVFYLKNYSNLYVRIEPHWAPPIESQPDYVYVSRYQQMDLFHWENLLIFTSLNSFQDALLLTFPSLPRSGQTSTSETQGTFCLEKRKIQLS